ncbi:MAG: hypothetical protein NW223_04410 [Hyphomicrobiaceae bacterium]|nr:hypothetical protein [Hyphomicrobiaceae bacterium]
MRVIIENVLLVLLPTIVYCGIQALRNAQRSLLEILNEAPLVALVVCGFLLVGGVRIYAAVTGESGTPQQEYIPPHMGKDGKIEPGRMK